MNLDDIQGNSRTDEPDPKPAMGDDRPLPSTGPAKIEPTPEMAREEKRRQQQKATP